MFNWFLHFFDLIFPKICITCQNSLLKNEQLICMNCLSDLSFLYDYQHLKDNKTYYQIAGYVPIQGAFSAFQFDKGGKLQEIIHHLKYKNQPYLGTLVGEFLAKQINQCPFPSNAVLLPIPLHAKKLKKRGYNQTSMIAKGIAKVWNLPINENDFIRIKFTETQTAKTKEERQKNVENIFQLLNTIQNPVVLIDDVVTTGSTLISACKTLYQNGVNDIYVVTLATAID